MLRDDIEIAKRAILKGFISSEQLREVLASQGGSDTETTVGRKSPVPIGTMLVTRGFLRPDQLATLLEEVRGYATASTPAPPAPAAAPAAPQPAPPEAAEPSQAPEPPSPHESEAPPEQRTFGKFMLVNRLGEGRSGTLYRAWQKNLRRWVTLRIPRLASPAERALFIEGAQRGAMLEHANILRTFEVGLQEQLPFAAMEYLKGRTLDQALALPQKRLIEIMIEGAAAIHFAHERNVVHGNIKPSNIMLADTGDRATPERVVVLDFAIPATGACPYTAPEVATSGQTPAVATDVYSLGATLYHVLTRRPPYEGPAPLDIAAQIMQNDPPAPRDIDSSIPPELDEIVRRAMSRQVESRTPTAAQLIAELKAHLRKGAAAARRRTGVRPGERERRPSRKAIVLAIAGVVALAIVLVVAFLLAGRRKTGASGGGSGDARALAQPAFERARQRWQDAEQLRYSKTATFDPWQGALRESLERLDKALAQDPKFAEAHVLRGRVLELLLDRESDAESAFSRAIECDGKAPAHLGRADVFLRRMDRAIEMRRVKEVAERRRESTAAALPDPFAADPELARFRDRAAGDLRSALDKGPDPFDEARARVKLSWLSWDLRATRDALDRMIGGEYQTKEELFLRRGRVRRYVAMENLGTLVPQNDRADRYAKALEEAAADFDQAGMLRPGDADALVEAGDTYLDQRTAAGCEKAAKRYADALRINPKLAAAHYQMGTCRLIQDRFREARQDFARCAELIPSDPGYLKLRAYAAWRASDPVDLEDAARQLANKFPTDPASWMFIGLRHMLGDNLDAADGALRKGLNVAPTDPCFLHLLGLLADLRNRPAEAVDYYSRALRAADDSVHTRIMLVEVLQQRGDLRLAVDELQRLRMPVDMEIAAIQGAILMLAGNAQGAIQVLEQVAQVQSQNRPTYALGNLALAYDWAGQTDRALPLFDQASREARQRSAAQNDPGEIGNLRRFWFAILANASTAMRAAGRTAEALKFAEEALRWSPDNVWAHVAMAEALEASGDKERAAKERSLAGGTFPTRGLVMFARRRWIRFSLAHARPGWPAATETITLEMLPLIREMVPVRQKE